MATPNLGLKNDYTVNSLISETWLNPVANNLDLAHRAAHGSKSVAGSSDVTLTLSEYDATSLEATGVLTGSINLILPLTAGRFWIVKNSTTGSYTLTVKGATGTGVVVNQGARVLVICDGANFYAPFVTGQTYTQTYATADRTLGAYTPDTESVAYTGAADSEAKLADLNALRVAYENLRAFTEDLAQQHNSLLDDLQSAGFIR